jgi:hypothetical protein
VTTAPWVLLAAALYLLPLALVFVVRAHPGRESWRAALDVPVCVAGDLLLILILARFLTLDVAALVSRAVWLGAGVPLLVRRRARVRAWWRATDRRAWIASAAAAALAVALSAEMSFACGLWDRQWHIPLSGTLRGQHTPFVNIYDHGTPLYYHYTGNALAAVFQALSLGTVHASNAQSRVHDLLFGLFGLSMAGLLPGLGIARLVPRLGVVAAGLLAGPATVLYQSPDKVPYGRSITSLYSLSFRPHVPLAYLLIVGFAGALLLPLLRRGDVPARATRPALFACTGLLVLTDETSLGLVGLMLGAVWLAAPHVLAESRKRGIAVAAALLVTIPAMALLGGGTLAPGGPLHAIELVSPRLPGFMQASVPLEGVAGWQAFIVEFMGIVGVWLAGLLALVTNRQRGEVRLVFLAYSTVAGIGLALLTTVLISKDGTECHRFATAPLLLAPMFGAYFATQPGRLWGAEPTRALVAALVVLSLGVPAVSSAEWFVGLKKSVCTQWGLANHQNIDCRKQLGARLGEKPLLAYAEQDFWFEIAGCRPLHWPTSAAIDSHNVPMGWPHFGWAGVGVARRWRPEGAQPLFAYCRPGATDPVCVRALAEPARCERQGELVMRCPLPEGPR